MDLILSLRMSTASSLAHRTRTPKDREGARLLPFTPVCVHDNYRRRRGRDTDCSVLLYCQKTGADLERMAVVDDEFLIRPLERGFLASGFLSLVHAVLQSASFPHSQKLPS